MDPWLQAAAIGLLGILIGLAFVFWGFIAFGGYTLTEFLRGLGIVDLTQSLWFDLYRVLLTPFAAAVLAGILFLLIRRAFLRPVGLGTKVCNRLRRERVV